MQPSLHDEVVITGMGVVSPIGCGEQPFWEALCTGRSGAGEVTCLDTNKLSRHVACQVREPLDGSLDMGRASQLAVSAAGQAVTGAGLSAKQVPADRLAVIVGTTMGETEFIEERLGSADADWLSDEHMERIARGRPGMLAGNVRRELAGPGLAIDLFGACAAGNMALAEAHRRIVAGACDVALAGGADGFSRLAFIGFMRLRIMAEGICRPFDEDRDGLLVGEGSAMFVLERRSFAEARGARARARISGCGVTSEDYHPTRPSPDGNGLKRAAQTAMQQAGVRPEDIDYVCAHGTGTPQNDAIEVQVMAELFPDGAAFSSVKALTGHTMGATAAVEAALCLLSIEHQTLIPTWNLRKPIAAAPLEALMEAPRQSTIRHALNNSAGFGGYNSSIVLSAC